MPPPQFVALVVFDHLQPLDLVGPYEVFAGANSHEVSLGRPAPYKLSVVAAAPGVMRSSSGLSILAEYPLPSAPVDTIMVMVRVGSRNSPARSGEIRPNARRCVR